MNLNVLHQRLLQDVLAIGNTFPLVLTGGYAVQAHGLVERLSRDVDVATNSNVPMRSIATTLIEAFDPPPDTTSYGPVLPLDAVIGTKVRALAGRGLPRDLIEYGISPADIASIRRWAQAWSDDIRSRMYQPVVDEDDEEELP